MLTHARAFLVGQVDYSASETDLQAFFGACGPVRRITIGRLPTGKPKGYAYVEFTDEKAVDAAKALSNQMLKGRQVTVRACLHVPVSMCACVRLRV